MSTIVVSQIEEGVCFVDIVTGGGKQGPFGFSFGAEKKNTELVSEILVTVSDRLNLVVSPTEARNDDYWH